jgi:hypothetical protein
MIATEEFPQAMFISAMPSPKLEEEVEESARTAEQLKRMVAIWN